MNKPVEVARVNKTELARVLGISTKQVGRYVDEGLPHTGTGQSIRFVVTQCVRWYADKQVQIALGRNQTVQDADIEEYKKRKVAADASIQEYKAAQIAKNMITVADAIAISEARLEQIRGKVGAIPGSWALRVVGLKSVPETMEVLGNLVHELLTDLTTYTEEDSEEVDLFESDEGDVKDAD